MKSVSERQRQRDRTLGLLGAIFSVMFLYRLWGAVLVPPSASPTAPATIWFVVASSTLLALLAWSVGRLTGDVYNRERLYRLVVGTLSTIGIGAALVFLGYAIATYPGHL